MLFWYLIQHGRLLQYDQSIERLTSFLIYRHGRGLLLFYSRKMFFFRNLHSDPGSSCSRPEEPRDGGHGWHRKDGTEGIN